MQKVVSFYEKLPRGPAPEPEGKGLLGRYQKKYMGKNPSARRAYSQTSWLGSPSAWPAHGRVPYVVSCEG
jgi:hypothetical protein